MRDGSRGSKERLDQANTLFKSSTQEAPLYLNPIEASRAVVNLVTMTPQKRHLRRTAIIKERCHREGWSPKRAQFMWMRLGWGRRTKALLPPKTIWDRCLIRKTIALDFSCRMWARHNLIVVLTPAITLQMSLLIKFGTNSQLNHTRYLIAPTRFHSKEWTRTRSSWETNLGIWMMELPLILVIPAPWSIRV